jgi:[protein-PII] uridylyltransferase
MTNRSDLSARRLKVAGALGFAVPGAGPARRAAVATLTREWLAGVWDEALAGRSSDGVALATVGSLARGDGGPLSDVDLVLLHDGRSLGGEELRALADRVWYPVWDAGVRLDHAVRTVNQCRTVASGDLSAAVGLLDLECLTGDAEVVAAARATLTHDWRANARKRLPQLLEAVRARHSRHGDLAQGLEPDLKEPHGGLRDMAVLRALAAAWLTDRPHGAVDESYAALLDVRDALHVVTGRGRERLTRQDHDAVAALLGHRDADDLLTGVSTAARTIAYALDGTVRRAGQSQRARTLRVGPRRPQLRPLGFGLFEHDGEVVLGPPRRPTRCSPCGRRWLPRATTSRLPPPRWQTWPRKRPCCRTRGPPRRETRSPTCSLPDRACSRCGKGSTRPASSSAGSRSGPQSARARNAARSTGTPSTGTCSRPSWSRAAWSVGSLVPICCSSVP